MAGIIRGLTFISRCGSQYRAGELEPLGITARQASSLMAISRTPGISQDHLSRRVVLNKSNITRQLDKLESMGLVYRSPSPKDKRVTQVFLTEKAQELIPQIRQIYRQWREYLLTGLTDQECAALEQLVGKLEARAEAWIDGGGTK